MVDIKREDITLQDRTKGISADEFAWGSYFYSEAISSGYNTKGFELWYRLSKSALNSRDKWYITALAPTDDYWFLAFTRDGRIETEEYWNWDSDWTWDVDGWWALYSFLAWGSLWKWYLNGVTYWDYAIGIRQNEIDVVDYKNAFTPSDEILTNTHLTISTWWTFGTGWTATDEWAVHTVGETWTLSTDISSEWLTNSDYCRCAIKISWWTNGNIDVTLGNNTETFNERTDGWFVAHLRWKATTTDLTITPNWNFNGTIEYVNLHLYDTTNAVFDSKASLYYSNSSNTHPALVREWDLYIACGSYVNIISLVDRWVTYKHLVDSNFTIVSMTQQAGNIILWATDGYDSRQYYWNWVDAVATEVIERKGLIIQGVTWTETLSYVLTTSWKNSWSIEWYEYRLYAVSWYQRNLIASKLYQNRSWDYLESPHYNENKKFDFNDVTSDQSMTIFLDSLYIPGCDGVYKYWYDVPGLRTNRTRPIKYDTGSTHIVMGQRWHFLGVWFTVWWTNYIGNVDNRLYPESWFLVTESIYRDRLSTKKSLEKLKIWYKNVASTVGNIKVYAIVDDTYFWRFWPSATPTTRPTVWAVYNVANNTKAEVIDVDTTNWVITFRTIENKWSYAGVANTTLTKVSWTWDDSISVGYNYDNMCLVKTIESSTQWYWADFIFWKDFINSYMPYWYKIQFVIELNSNSRYLSPEVYELSIHSDIDDVVL